jgi:hypothetical protein
MGEKCAYKVKKFRGLKINSSDANQRSFVLRNFMLRDN